MKENIEEDKRSQKNSEYSAKNLDEPKERNFDEFNNL